MRLRNRPAIPMLAKLFAALFHILRVLRFLLVCVSARSWTVNALFTRDHVVVPAVRRVDFLRHDVGSEVVLAGASAVAWLGDGADREGAVEDGSFSAIVTDEGVVRHGFFPTTRAGPFAHFLQPPFEVNTFTSLCLQSVQVITICFLLL